MDLFFADGGAGGTPRHRLVAQDDGRVAIVARRLPVDRRRYVPSCRGVPSLDRDVATRRYNWGPDAVGVETPVVAKGQWLKGRFRSLCPQRGIHRMPDPSLLGSDLERPSSYAAAIFVWSCERHFTVVVRRNNGPVFRPPQ